MLAEAEFADVIQSHYGIRVEAVVRKRSVVGIISTDDARYIWKPSLVSDTEERLRALSRMDVVYRATRTRCALPIPTQSGRFIVRIADGRNGYLQPWIEGRHLQVQRRSERLGAIRSLAEVHRSAKSHRYPGREHLWRGTLLHKLRAKERALLRVWPTVERAQPFLRRWRKELAECMRDTIEFYEASMTNMQNPWLSNLSFCHRDLAPHNLLVDDKESVGWIDFDHAGYDDMLSDPMQLISHTVFLSDLSTDDYMEMFEVYAEAAELDSRRAGLLHRLAGWPDIMIRTLLEWAKNGCPQSGETKVLYAVACERRRQSFYE